MRHGVAAAAVAFAAATAQAADIEVPRDHRNLKDALIAAQPGDRVIVNGGTWRNGRVATDRVALVGRGARFTGQWEVSGVGAVVEGCTFVAARVLVSGPATVIRGNRFLATSWLDMGGTTGALVEGNRLSNSWIACNEGAAPGLVVRGNRMRGDGIGVRGDGAIVEDNVVTNVIGVHDSVDAVLRRNSARTFDVEDADGVRVEDNAVENGAISVRGCDRAIVERNRAVRSFSLVVTGDETVVRENHVSGTDCHFRVQGNMIQVTDNVVRGGGDGHPYDHGTMWIEGNGPIAVLRNDVEHRGLQGMWIRTDFGEIAGNVVRGTGGDESLVMLGSGNRIHDNVFESARPTAGSSAMVLEGDDNVIRNLQFVGTRYDGIEVTGARNTFTNVTVRNAGRCGITIAETSTSTTLSNCTVEGAGWAALYILGAETTVTGGSFTGGRRVDVLDLGTGTQLIGMTFETQSTNAQLRPYR